MPAAVRESRRKPDDHTEIQQHAQRTRRYRILTATRKTSGLDDLDGGMAEHDVRKACKARGCADKLVQWTVFRKVFASAPVGLGACHWHAGPPSGGRWCPVGTVQRRPSRQADFLGGPPVRRGLPQASLKPAPSAAAPLAEATAVFQSVVPPLRGYRPLGVCASYAALFHRLRRVGQGRGRCSTPRKL